VEPIVGNATPSQNLQPKLKGKQRWRARQRELREASARLDNGLKEDAINTRDVEESSREDDIHEKHVNAAHMDFDGQTEPVKAMTTEQKDERKVSPWQDLPKPSHLRPSLKDILREKLLQKHLQIRRPARKSNPGGDKLKDSMAIAPFQTAFAQNPYAHILASPVREDILSRVHLPMSCLLAFHIAELDQVPDPAETITRNKGKRERDRMVQHQLLPLSLAAELAPSSTGTGARNNHDKKPRINEAMKEEARSLRPTGSASYLSANFDALSFISKDTKRRLIPFGLSRRMHHEIGMNRDMQPAQVKWRNDMPDFVLAILRSIVAKKLGYLLKSKGARDRPGLIYEVLGGGRDLRRLHHMEDVSCVIRLTPNALGEESDGGASPLTLKGNNSQQTWRDYSFLDEVMPLPYSQSCIPTPSPSAQIVAYRNINIPVYSMHSLLGPTIANKLVAQTTFAQGGRPGTEQEIQDDEDEGLALKEPTKYVVLTRSNGTIQAQIWLSKLQNFVGDSTMVR